MQLLVLLASASIAAAFVGRRVPTKSSRLHENFGFGEDIFFLVVKEKMMFPTDFAEDSYANTPKEILGEENYVSFVTSYDPQALRGDALRYNVS